ESALTSTLTPPLRLTATWTSTPPSTLNLVPRVKVKVKGDDSVNVHVAVNLNGGDNVNPLRGQRPRRAAAQPSISLRISSVVRMPGSCEVGASTGLSVRVPGEVAEGVAGAAAGADDDALGVVSSASSIAATALV